MIDGRKGYVENREKGVDTKLVIKGCEMSAKTNLIGFAQTSMVTMVLLLNTSQHLKRSVLVFSITKSRTYKRSKSHDYFLV